uniref:Cytochrome c oxidase subunit 3 n=1 Tax=Bothridium pithonis TaxID=1648426 RepID=A0A8F7CC06_9CEST|nr:cytochrome c oxidase subunit 3 [Bothridium pithonis]
MSFLPILNSMILGLFVSGVFLWKLHMLLLVLVFLVVILTFFWFDLLNWGLHYESAFWLFIVTEVAAFGSLLICCLWFDTCSFVNLSSSLELPFLGCFILLGSSVTVTGFHHLLFWEYSWVLLSLTIVLGICFVGMQLYEFNEIGINIYDSSFHASSFCTVGLHFSHVLIGAVGLSLVLFLGVVAVGEYRCTLVTWYWHFVDYIWLVVYTVVYVC